MILDRMALPDGGKEAALLGADPDLGRFVFRRAGTVAYEASSSVLVRIVRLVIMIFPFGICQDLSCQFKR